MLIINVLTLRFCPNGNNDAIHLTITVANLRTKSVTTNTQANSQKLEFQLAGNWKINL